MVNLETVVGNLIDINEKKYSLLVDVLELTKSQTKAINEEKIEELALLIDKKQVRIDAMKQLDIRFESIVDDLKVVYGIKSLDEIEGLNVESLKTGIEKIVTEVKEICDLEAKNRKNLSEAKEELSKKIKHAGNGKSAVKQYSSFENYADAYFIDKKIK